MNVSHVIEIPAHEEGVIAELPAMEFGLYAMRLGAGRAVKSDQLDYETGIVFDKKVGDSVKKGEIVAKSICKWQNFSGTSYRFPKIC